MDANTQLKPNFLFRLYAGLVFYSLATLMTVFWSAMIGLGRVLPASGPEAHSRRAHRTAGRWGTSVFSVIPGWKVEVSGQENLPQDGDPVVMVANHESLVDILVMYFLGIQFRWLSKESVFKIPLVGPCMRICGYIPIRRGERNSHEEALAASAQWLKKGVNMFFFAEGTRSEIPGQMRPFKIGAFKLANECGVDVLPVAIRGAGKLWRKNGKLPDSATVRLRVLPRTRMLEGETYEAYATRVRAIIESALAELAQAPSSQ
jgi:1-acyl-sn-glycerol-3-phosphate acyltransferase